MHHAHFLGQILGQISAPLLLVRARVSLTWIKERPLREILELIEAGKIEPPGEAIAAKELSEQYIEYVTWARDVDSGLRCESLIFRAQK